MPDQADNPYQLTTAELHWYEGDVPASNRYDDVYFSKKQGLEESRYVFLQHNQLTQRWQQLEQRLVHQQQFTIAETGFGTGLNFLAAWQLWRQTAPATATLHFISVEKHPLTQADIARALTAWPELSALAKPLIKQYPSLVPGHHLLDFDQQRVKLHLLFDDAIDGFEQLRNSSHPLFQHQPECAVDAWFLDGFAPARNPEMWNETLYSLVADLSDSHTTLATFTAGGDVRRGLAKQGFNISKAPGFGKKREMLYGSFDPHIRNQQQPATSKLTSASDSKTVSAPWIINRQRGNNGGRHVAIIGGGLAGCSSAYAMAKRGWQVTLLDSSAELAQGASGNPQGMLYTKLSAEAGLLNQFTLSSYMYALRFYRQWRQRLGRADNSKELIDLCGVLQLASSDKDQQLLQTLSRRFSHCPELIQFLNPLQATTQAGIDINCPAWFFPAAGWVSPPPLCHSLASHAAIEKRFNYDVQSLEYDDEKRQWQLNGSKQSLRSDAVIIANSRDAQQFSQSAYLPTKTIRGQISLLPAGEYSSDLKTVICHEGYLTPAINGLHNIGATFDNGDTNTEIRNSDHQRNLDSLGRAMPTLLKNIDTIDANHLQGRAGLRCSSPDYLPMVGPVANYQHFIDDYAPLRKNARAKITTAGSYYPRLYINIGHGSRGLTSTPICSELIAAALNQEIAPLPRALTTALNPARFIIRDLIRNKI
ncbi:MAG: tRNA 5-methylaminomethyl-2-thiouridine biosynthesis bifunctional protein [Oceanicoccus sp.]|jgi:tRNA 5-methylaminomethyl-2-thiouridine biosynthesis bifunctional protein